MHTLEHMAPVLTNTVDNVSNDAPHELGCSSSQEISAGLGCIFNVEHKNKDIMGFCFQTNLQLCHLEVKEMWEDKTQAIRL